VARTRKRTPYNPAHDRRARESNRGVNGHLDPIEVDDPMEPGARLIVMRSIRNDPLGSLHARKQIDDAQFWGGRCYQRDFEAVERGPRAIDPGKEYVDGGAAAEPITEAQQKAALKLASVHRALGQNGAALIQNSLIHGMSMDQMVAARNLDSEAERKYLGKRFRECLNSLAFEYGLLRRKGDDRRIDADGDVDERGLVDTSW
jgi:hypothetical protein